MSFRGDSNRFELIPVWVHVHGVPHALRHFLGLWAVGSVIGATLDVDLLCLRRRGIVRIQVGVLNLDAFKMSLVNSLTSDVVVQKKGYEFRYTLEDDDFRADADFVPRVWEHGDDTEGDKEHDREDTSRADDKSKRPKASSSSANTAASSSLGGVVPMQITSSTTVPASTHPCLASRPLSGDPPAATELVPPQNPPSLASSAPPPPPQPDASPMSAIRTWVDGPAAPLAMGSPSEAALEHLTTPTSASSRSSGRRGVIFSPAVRADHESVLATLRVRSSVPPSQVEQAAPSIAAPESEL